MCCFKFVNHSCATLGSGRSEGGPYQMQADRGVPYRVVRELPNYRHRSAESVMLDLTYTFESEDVPSSHPLIKIGKIFLALGFLYWVIGWFAKGYTQ